MLSRQVAELGICPAVDPLDSTSRILDPQGTILQIVNNYSRISFNLGPTLLAWMQERAPDVLAAIVEADQQSRQRFSGHGNALAQVYNHMILPLTNPRDKVTQVRWGLRDFEHRFGRKPEGMWMAETAADTPSLEVLAEHGIQFTILSPFQASRVRPLRGGQWKDEAWRMGHQVVHAAQPDVRFLGSISVRLPRRFEP